MASINQAILPGLGIPDLHRSIVANRSDTLTIRGPFRIVNVISVAAIGVDAGSHRGFSEERQEANPTTHYRQPCQACQYCTSGEAMPWLYLPLERSRGTRCSWNPHRGVFPYEGRHQGGLDWLA